MRWEIEATLWVLGTLLVIGLLIGGIVWLKTIEKDKCERGCKRLDVEFFEFSNGRFGRDACFCLDKETNKPFLAG